MGNLLSSLGGDITKLVFGEGTPFFKDIPNNISEANIIDILLKLLGTDVSTTVINLGGNVGIFVLSDIITKKTFIGDILKVIPTFDPAVSLYLIINVILFLLSFSKKQDDNELPDPWHIITDPFGSLVKLFKNMEKRHQHPLTVNYDEELVVLDGKEYAFAAVSRVKGYRFAAADALLRNDIPRRDKHGKIIEKGDPNFRPGIVKYWKDKGYDLSKWMSPDSSVFRVESSDVNLRREMVAARWEGRRPVPDGHTFVWPPYMTIEYPLTIHVSPRRIGKSNVEAFPPPSKIRYGGHCYDLFEPGVFPNPTSGFHGYGFKFNNASKAMSWGLKEIYIVQRQIKEFRDYINKGDKLNPPNMYRYHPDTLAMWRKIELQCKLDESTTINPSIKIIMSLVQKYRDAGQDDVADKILQNAIVTEEQWRNRAKIQLPDLPDDDEVIVDPNDTKITTYVRSSNPITNTIGVKKYI